MPTLPTKNPFEGIFSGQPKPAIQPNIPVKKGIPATNPFSGMFPEQKPQAQESITIKPQNTPGTATEVKPWEKMSWLDKLKAVIKETPNTFKMAREEITKIAETPFLGIKPAYAPANESDVFNKEITKSLSPEGKETTVEKLSPGKLQEDYGKSLLGKYTHKEEISKGNFISGLTGGLIKPETEAPKDISDKVIGGISNVMGSVVAIQSIGTKIGSLAMGNQTIAQAVSKYPTVAKYVFPFAKNAVGFDIYGQLDPDLQNRSAKLAYDTILSVPFTGLGFIKSAKISIPASFGLGFGLAKLDGASDEDAVVQGGILGILDAYGRTGGTDTHFVRGRYTDKVLKNEAVKTINEFSDIKITPNSTAEEISKAFRSAATKTHPDKTGGNDLNFKRVNSANQFLTGEAVSFEPKKAEPKPEAAKPQEPKASDLQKEIIEKTKNKQEQIVPENIVKDNVDLSQKEILKQKKESLSDNKSAIIWEKLKDTLRGSDISELKMQDYQLETRETDELAKWDAKTAGDQSRIDKIKTAIQNGEILPPIIISKSGQVIDGHNRLEAYRELEIKEISAMVETGKGNGKIFEEIKPENEKTKEFKKELDNISEELQAKADEDWQNNYSEKFGELANREMELQRKIKEGTKSEAENLQPELEKVRGEMGKMEDEWVAKWQKETEKTKPAEKQKNEETAKISQKTTSKIDITEAKKEKPSVDTSNSAKKLAYKMISGYFNGAGNHTYERLKAGDFGEQGDKNNVMTYAGSDDVVVSKVNGEKITPPKVFNLKEIIKDLSQEKDKKVIDEITKKSGWENKTEEEIKTAAAKELAKKLYDEEKAQKKEKLKELLLKDIRDSEKELGKIYKVHPKAEEELANIWQEIMISEAGERISITDDTGRLTTEWLVKSSSFPQWIPEPLRLKELFDKVIGGLKDIDNIKYPSGRGFKQRLLYDLIFDELDMRLGVDTNSIRENIIKNYEQIYSNKNEESLDRGDEGEKGGNGGNEISAFTRENAKSRREKAVTEINAKKSLSELVEDNEYLIRNRTRDKLAKRWDNISYSERENTRTALNRVMDELKKLGNINSSDLKFYEDFINNVPVETLKNLDIRSVIIEDAKNYDRMGSLRETRLGGLLTLFFNKSVKFEAGTLYHEYGHHYYNKYLTREENDTVNQVWDIIKKDNKKLDLLLGRELIEKYGEINEPEIYKMEMFARLFTDYADRKINDRYAEQINNDEASTLWGKLRLIFDRILTKLKEFYYEARNSKLQTNPSLDRIFEKIYKPSFDIKEGKFIVPEKIGKRNFNFEAGMPRQRTSPETMYSLTEKEKVSPIKWGETDLNLANMDKPTAIELPEMVELVKNLTGNTPEVSKKLKGGIGGGGVLGRFYPLGKGRIKILASLFKDTNIAARTLAHEIGHLTDYLPEKTISRGNLLGRLLSLQRYLKNTFGGDLFEGKPGLNIKNSEIKEELKKVTQYWKPFDEKMNVSFTKYRYSAAELYADAISVLFNDPAKLEELAPKFYNAFFENLDSKPEVKKNYFELQSLLSGDRSVLVKHRRAGVRGMFDEGDFRAKEVQTKRMEEKKKRENDWMFRIKFDLIDKNYALIERVDNLKKRGITVNDDENPVYFLEEKNYIGGKIKALVEQKFNPVYQNLTKNEISWVDFGEGLFYERIIAGDRSEVANPRGIAPKDAQEMLDTLKNDLGDKKWLVIKDEMEKYRSALKEVAEEAYKEGLYSKELYDEMKKNPAYVAFRVIEHIEDKLSSKVYHQVGTLKDVQNPADVSILKTIETIKVIERNKTSRSIIEFLQSHYPSDVKDAKEIFTGKGKRPIESRLPNEDLITYYQDGKIQGFYVDPYIAKSMEINPIWANNVMIGSLKYFNSGVFRPLFISFNLGFQSFNLIRDFARFYKNIPGMTLWRAMQRYKQAYHPAKMRAFDLPANPTEADIEANEMIQRMEKEQILSVTFNDLMKGETVEDKQIDEILKRSGVGSFKPDLPGKYSLYRFKPVKIILDFIENLGNMIETLPKVAGLYELEGKMPDKEMKSFIRRKIGSPDFLAGGYLKPATNEVFLFSNAITQGIRSDYEVAMGPKTRSGYWWKTAKLSIFPKILMIGALLGLFGDKIKKIMEDASEYDRTNYTIIPLGVDENNKAIYLRLPQDETGRLISGIFWKAFTFQKKFDTVASKILDILSYTGGQLPSISPVLSVGSSITQFLGGQNPYDFFRGRNVLTDQQFQAGGMYALKPYAGWLFDQLGGGIVMRFYNSNTRPENKSGVEKFVSLPIFSNIVGRFIRVTDYGETEKLRKQLNIVKQKEAQEQLRTNEIVNKYLETGIKEKDPQKLRDIEHAMVGEILGRQPQTESEATKARALVKKFKIARIRGFADPKIDVLTSANTNEQKLELLRTFKETMGRDEFVDLEKFVVSEKIVSPDVINQLNR